jgi:hypothetical protein
MKYSAKIGKVIGAVWDHMTEKEQEQIMQILLKASRRAATLYILEHGMTHVREVMKQHFGDDAPDE